MIRTSKHRKNVTFLALQRWGDADKQAMSWCLGGSLLTVKQNVSPFIRCNTLAYENLQA